MKNVKATFRYANKNTKARFKTSQCLHKREKFVATLELVNKSFNSCNILICDSLQRYTMALDSKKNAEMLHETAFEERNLRLVRNKKYCNALTITKKISRWDTLLNHPNFLQMKTKLNDLIKNDLLYKKIFDNTINQYLFKYSNRLNNLCDFDTTRARQLCFNYVLEEYAALCLWSELNCDFELYPNRHNDAMEETRKRFVLSKHPNLLIPLAINFKNTSQTKPQYFEFAKETI